MDTMRMLLAFYGILPPDLASYRQLDPYSRNQLAEWEGAPGTHGKPVLTAYRDSVGTWTIGIGHTGPEVVEGLVWTEQQCWDAFDADLMPACKVVQRCVSVPLNDHQFAALVSLAFNIGVTAFANSTLVKELNKPGGYAKVPENLATWVWGHVPVLDAKGQQKKNLLGKPMTVKVKIKGLVNRRALETSLWGLPVSEPSPPAIIMEHPGNPDASVIKAAVTPLAASDFKSVEVSTATPIPPPQTVLATKDGASNASALGLSVAAAITQATVGGKAVVASITAVIAGTATLPQWGRIIVVAFVGLAMAAMGYTWWRKHATLQGKP